MWFGPEDHQLIGAFLRKVRVKADVTQVELARRLEKPQAFVSSYERGQRRVDLMELTQIVLALGGNPRKVGGALLDEVVAHLTRGARS